jgi:hypothetical protein
MKVDPGSPTSKPPGLPPAPNGSASPTIQLPPWLSKAKDAITSTRQWQKLVKEIQGRVAEDLANRGLKVRKSLLFSRTHTHTPTHSLARTHFVPSQFSDLNPYEQQALVEQVHSDLTREDHDSVGNFEKALSGVCDTEIAAEVRRVVPAEDEIERGDGKVGSGLGEANIASDHGNDPAEALTTASKIVSVATTAVISLLEQLPPEHRALTRLMLGQPFPEPLRPKAWALSLKHASARREYETALARRRVDTISTMDVQITQEVREGEGDRLPLAVWGLDSSEGSSERAPSRAVLT